MENQPNLPIQVPSWMKGIQRTFFLHYAKQYMKDGMDADLAITLAEQQSNAEMAKCKKTLAIVRKSGFTY